MNGSLGNYVTNNAGEIAYNFFSRITGFGNKNAGQVESFQSVSGLTWHHNATLSDFGFVSATDYHLSPDSFGIDFGAPWDSSWTNEPSPNGSRVNVGLYGGTEEATCSSETPWVHALAYDGGGMLVGTGTLVWASGNLGENATVDLQYTTNGVNWADVATGITATNEQYFWVPSFDSPFVRWRVKSSSSDCFGMKTVTTC